METDSTLPSHSHIDLSNLQELTGGDRNLVIKYINIFITTSRVQLATIQAALAKADGDMLFGALHTLKPQLEIMGIKKAFQQTEIVLLKLREKREVGEVEILAANFIANEITLAYRELESFENTGD